MVQSEYIGMPIQQPPRGKPITEASGPIMVVPYPRNPDVVVRAGIFTELDLKLPPVTTHQSVAVWGLGGTG